MKPSETLFGLIRIPVDFLMTLLAFVLAYGIRSNDLVPGINVPFDPQAFPSLNEYLRFSMIAAGFLVLINALRKMYSLKSSVRITREIRQILTTTSIWLMAIIAYFFLIRSFPFSRLAIIYTWILAIVLIASGRAIIRFLQHLFFRAGVGKKCVVFIGYNNITKKLAAEYSKDIGYKVVGFLDATHPHEADALKHLGTLEDLPRLIKSLKIEEIIQTKTDLAHAEGAKLLAFCRENHLGFNFVPNLLEIQQGNIETETWGNIPVIKLKPTPLDGWGKVYKRAFDLFGSGVGLILLSPLFLIVTIAIKLDSKGTVFFKYLDDGSRVKRVGEHGKLFNFYKFRTMHPNTHNLRYTELADKNTRDGSPLVKIKNDPRITRVGKFLRKTSIDELPNLFNVLKGEMSLVGPRPHLPEEVARYAKHHKFVLEIKPGITGLAQTSGRSDLNFEEEIRLDTYYIERWSMAMDLRILLKTIIVLFKDYQE